MKSSEPIHVFRKICDKIRTCTHEFVKKEETKQKGERERERERERKRE